jgi:hypothetical protein
LRDKVAAKVLIEKFKRGHVVAQFT